MLKKIDSKIIKMGLLFLVALLIRVVYTVVKGGYDTSDTLYYMGQSDLILQKGLFFYIDNISTPYYWGYPTALAILRSIFGDNLMAICLVQAVLGAVATLILAWLIANITNNINIALGAGLLYTCIIDVVMWDAMVMSDSLGLFWEILFLCAFYALYTRKTKNLLWFIVFGFLFFATRTNAICLILPCLFALILSLDKKIRRKVLYGFFIVLAICVIALIVMGRGARFGLLSRVDFIIDYYKNGTIIWSRPEYDYVVDPSHTGLAFALDCILMFLKKYALYWAIWFRDFSLAHKLYSLVFIGPVFIGGLASAIKIIKDKAHLYYVPVIAVVLYSTMQALTELDYSSRYRVPVFACLLICCSYGVMCLMQDLKKDSQVDAKCYNKKTGLTLMGRIAIVIPAYEPDERLLKLLEEMDSRAMGPIVLVNDGSLGPVYDEVFQQALGFVEKSGGHLLVHEVNKGKGRALKTAFSFLMKHEPDISTVVTVDSDGQHTCDCIQKVMDVANDKPDSLVLGVRRFDLQGIPWKSRFGNNLTEKIFKYVTGQHVSDTQTGLRAIPCKYLQEFIEIKGERFEYEMRMLVEAVGKMPVIEVPIETIYDSQSNHQTHFNPIKDSVRIYRILGEKFLKFIISSLSSSLIDLVLFSLFCMLLQPVWPLLYVTMATVLARIISATYNYMINYMVVFKSREKIGMSALKYITLACGQMLCSAVFVTILVAILPVRLEVIYKIIVDTLLFFISYKIQQKLVFKGK